jgi:hemerythrin-like domain-containing protein
MAQTERSMQPIGPLMIEHRLIEHMIRLFRVEMDRIGEYGRADAGFIDQAVSFMKAYADIGHHGKEENILFRELEAKPLTAELRRTMADLVQEHVFVRRLVNDLVEAKENYLNKRPGAMADIISSMNIIIEFYPKHIEKEDRHFFLPAMDYFSDGEKEDMLRKFQEYDSRLYHEEHKATVRGMEERWHTAAGAIVK